MIHGTLIDLRPAHATDIATLRVWEGEAEIRRWLATTAAALDARESPEQEYDRLLRAPRVRLLVIQTKAQQAVGFLRLNDLDFIHRNATIRLFVAPAHQGRGYATDALRTLARYCFQDLHLHRLSLVVRADNDRARRLYDRLGFATEGCQREAVWQEGRWVDFTHMGLLARDWRALEGV